MKSKVRIFTHLATILILSAVHVASSAQENENSSRDKAAKEALNTFNKLVTAENFKNYGLKSLEDRNEVKLGNPIQVYMIRLDSLKNPVHSTGKKIFTGGNKVIYPLLISDNIIISSAEFDKKDNKWEMRSFGNKTVIKNYSDQLIQIKDSLAQTYLVRIPSLALSFMAIEQGNKIMLHYLGETPINDISPGKPILLEDMLHQLRPLAEKYNGLPW